MRIPTFTEQLAMGIHHTLNHKPMTDIERLQGENAYLRSKCEHLMRRVKELKEGDKYE